MIKLIFKNLWARRRRNAWVLIELILITIVAWVVLDPAIVSGYYFSLDSGYDVDRLVTLDLLEIPEGGRGYDEASAETRMDDVHRLLDKVRSNQQVETATITSFQMFESGSLNVSSFPKDSADGCYVVVKFFPNTDFFKTFGIKGLDGNVFNEPPVSGNDIIISRSVGDIMHPGINPLGHYLNEGTDSTAKHFDWDRNKLIAGVTDEAIYRSYMGRSPIIYKYDKERKVKYAGDLKIVIRLKPGVNPDRFIVDYSPVVNSELKAGNVYAHSPMTFEDRRDSTARETRNKYVISLALALFFFVNLCLGIIGTFYLQTRTRSRDTGVMRSFGATPSYVLREIMSEGWIMTTLAWIIGCGLYCIYANKHGLYEAEGVFWGHSDTIISVLPQWCDFFWSHFWVVSGIIYVALIITVSIGIYIPARRISRTNPVDALKDE